MRLSSPAERLLLQTGRPGREKTRRTPASFPVWPEWLPSLFGSICPLPSSHSRILPRRELIGRESFHRKDRQPSAPQHESEEPSLCRDAAHSPKEADNAPLDGHVALQTADPGRSPGRNIPC